jgi:hypothetical protein
MNVDVTVSIDIEEIFNNLSPSEKGKFCDIALDYLDDSELIDVLKNRNCDWSYFGLKEE